MTVIEFLREQAEQIDQNNNAAITSQQELFRKELEEVKELHDVQYFEKEQKWVTYYFSFVGLKFKISSHSCIVLMV